MPNIIHMMQAAAGRDAIPAVPTMTYTAQNQFTITNYDATLTYTLTNCTRSGNLITPTGSTATVTAKYPRGLSQSAARTAYTANHAIVFDSVAATPSSTGCGPRPDLCCPEGATQSASAYVQCGGSPGTQGDWCGGACPGDCFGLFVTCWWYHWTDYSGSGYSLIGTVWGKVT